MKMKKVVAMLLSVAMVASMAVGCGSKDDSKDANEDGKKVLKFAAFEGGNGTEIWENIEKALNNLCHDECDTFLENCNRMAGYNGSRFSIEYGCPVSEAQEEYDIWKAQFPKNLERTEIRHN